jgi:hypothetical protein
MSLMSPFKYSFVNDEGNAGEQVDVLSIQENSKLGKMTEDGNQSFNKVQNYVTALSMSKHIFQAMLPAPGRRREHK